MNIDLKKLHISDKLPLPTEKELEEYMRVLHNEGCGGITVMALLAIPKLILLVKHYQDRLNQMKNMD